MRAAGFEPAGDSLQCANDELVSDPDVDTCIQIHAQISDGDRWLLSQVVESWPRLSPSLKLAVLAIVAQVSGRENLCRDFLAEKG